MTPEGHRRRPRRRRSGSPSRAARPTAIARIDPRTGDITEHAAAARRRRRPAITVGADGNLWFIERRPRPSSAAWRTDGRRSTSSTLGLSGERDAQGHHQRPRRLDLVHGRARRRPDKTRTSSLHSVSRLEPRRRRRLLLPRGPDRRAEQDRRRLRRQALLHRVRRPRRHRPRQDRRQRSRSSATTGSPPTPPPSASPRAATRRCGSPAPPAPGRIGRLVTKKHEFTEFAGGTAEPRPARRRRPRRHHARPRRQHLVHRERPRPAGSRRMTVPPAAELELDPGAGS